MGNSAAKIPVGKDSFSPAMAEASGYMEWTLSDFQPVIRGRILEIGVGHGSYYQFLRSKGDYYGLDIDLGSVEEARKRYPDATFYQADLTAPATAEQLKGGFDTIVCFNVLEHIDDDLSAMQAMINGLTPDGHLCLLVPAFEFLYNDLDRLAGHCRRYTTRHIGDLVREAGGETIGLRYFNAVGGVGWLANRLLRHDSLADDRVNNQIRVFERFVLPIASAVDPLTSSIFGQSVLCTARRRQSTDPV